MEDLYVRFGENIRRERRRRGFSQERLGELASIGRPTVAAIEAGRQAVTLQQAVSLSAGLGIELQALVGVGMPTDELSTLVGMLEDQDLDIIRSIRRGDAS